MHISRNIPENNAKIFGVIKETERCQKLSEIL